MESFLVITLFFFIFYYLNNKFNKLNLLVNYRGQKHQKFIGLKNVPLSGGVFLLITIIVLFLYYNYNLLLALFLFLIFLLGFFSDIDSLSSPRIRFFIQTLIMIFCVILLEIFIQETKFELLDIFLENIYFKYFFSVFCLLILINGSNFIDGLNGLLLGYFTIIFFIIFNLNLYEDLGVNRDLIISLIMMLFYLFIMNINKKLFMGDSGSYLLSLLCGYFLIKIYDTAQDISPYFIILLLWYPCFENLFSILRKFSLKKSPINADNNHLHQLVFFYVQKKIKNKKLNANNLSSFLILFYNLFIFMISLEDPSNTKFQIILIIINIMFYLFIYFRLFIFKYKIRFYN